MKVVIRDFQSIEKAELEVKGLTVVTGRSNIGKSAIVRAVEAAMFGLKGESFIRDGAPATNVRLEADDFKLEWHKVRPGSSQKTYLEINGATNTTIGIEHTNLTEPLGMKQVRTKTATLLPQVASQFDQIFLITETETTAAEILKMIGRADVITHAQQSVKSDLRGVESKFKVRFGDHSVAADQLGDANILLTHVEGLRDKYSKGFDDCMSKVLDAEIWLRKLARLKQLTPKLLPQAPEPLKPVRTQVLAALRRMRSLKPRKVPRSPEQLVVPRSLAILRLVKIYKQAVIDKDTQLRRIQAGEDMIVTMGKLLTKLEQEMGACPLCKKKF